MRFCTESMQTLQTSREHIPPHQIQLTAPEAAKMRLYRLPK
ncbi:unnamed protein product [Penicillium camemberti]|uniref:Str. FM013 n=1 Tax=Penicillium camemberti (strain FM 013) TaxID=1429867 RepID=A0A0G4P8C4_PENC3|nr:unnamed protein product [Penicillium camemberti]